ncbi:hypothetical protein VTJ04DRAFT_7346 [Mycothermus thermophilus]|uniref:uncharacterized protein n=1 Tax=Humicola insolens TaxID=85995 RepID=UPI00374420AF
MKPSWFGLRSSGWGVIKRACISVCGRVTSTCAVVWDLGKQGVYILPWCAWRCGPWVSWAGWSRSGRSLFFALRNA